MSSVTFEFAEPFEFLYKEKSRYKVLYGGRGGGKSWGVADALLVAGYQGRERILCTREFQNSIKDSVHKLLSDRIATLGLSKFYVIQNTSIKGLNGTEFLFEGLKTNVDSIKSMEGITKVWVEEAHRVSGRSWEILIPTIRQDGSEIWVTFNPELDTDETYRRFVLYPPRNATVRKVNWDDNPWFPKVLEEEMQELKARDPDAYQHVWLGFCKSTLEGAVYAKELRQAQEEGRITHVPYDPVKPVHTFWDIGWRDSTAIWFAQAIGFEYRILDYLEDTQKNINHFLKLMQDKGYVYGTHYLPHDADSTNAAAQGRTFAGLLRAAGRKVVVLPRMKVKAVGINAVRTIFPNCWFDEKRCADGLNSLRRFRFEKDAETNVFKKVPEHDEYSHGADAFAQLALSLKEKRDKKEPVKKSVFVETGIAGTGWMA